MSRTNNNKLELLSTHRVDGAVGKLKDLVWPLKLYLLRERFQSHEAAATDVIISTVAKNRNQGQLIKLIVRIVRRLSHRTQ